jgi:hypothetical protein
VPVHPLDAASVARNTGEEVAVSIAAAATASTKTTTQADAAAGGGGGGVWGRGGGKVGDVFGLWVFGSDGGDARVGGFAGFGEGVVA